MFHIFAAHLEILKWARENGCDWGTDTCSSAAAGGHFEIIKWARENGCDWDSSTCSNAAWNGARLIDVTKLQSINPLLRKSSKNFS